MSDPVREEGVQHYEQGEIAAGRLSQLSVHLGWRVEGSWDHAVTGWEEVNSSPGRGSSRE